jgi:hypothetical protein
LPHWRRRFRRSSLHRTFRAGTTLVELTVAIDGRGKPVTE